MGRYYAMRTDAHKAQIKDPNGGQERVCDVYVWRLTWRKEGCNDCYFLILCRRLTLNQYGIGPDLFGCLKLVYVRTYVYRLEVRQLRSAAP